MIIWPPKDPAATELFAFDFTNALGSAAISGTPVVVGNGVTVSAVIVNGARVQFSLSGGTAGTVATVNCTATLSTGEVVPELGVVAIGGEVLSLDTAKAAQKIEVVDEDALLAGFLRAAIGTVEAQTAKNLTEKIELQTVDGFPACDKAIRLWKGPASQILTIEYDDADGAAQTLSSFRLVEGKDAKLLPAYGNSWPLTARGPVTVRISYVAGYDPAELPPELTQAAILLFGHFNANREAVVVAQGSAQVAELPLGVAMLIDPYRVPGIA